MKKITYCLLPTLLLIIPGCAVKQSNAAAAAKVPAPEHLQVQLRNDPIAVNAHHPRFGWRLPWKGYGVKQTGYQIIVASSPTLLAKNDGNLWNSGRVNTDRSINIHYAGSPLAAREHCFWKVRVWNQDGRPSAWSQAGQWREALWVPAQWHHAQWIGWKPRWKKGYNHPLPAIYLRDQFDVNKPVKRAIAYFSGIGLGRMYINGKRTSDTQLSPPLSWYPKRCY